MSLQDPEHRELLYKILDTRFRCPKDDIVVDQILDILENRSVHYDRYSDEWDPRDLNANFKSEVRAYTIQDPMPSLARMSVVTDIPMTCLIRYVLCKYFATFSDLKLAMPPLLVSQMVGIVKKADEGDDQDCADAYLKLREIILTMNMEIE